MHYAATYLNTQRINISVIERI